MSRLSKNIIYNLIGQGLLVVLGFIAVRYIYKQLGEDALGIIYFIATLNIVLCGVLRKGVNSTIVREISSHYKEEPEYIHRLIRTGSLLYWAVYTIFSIGVFIGAPVLVEKWINLKTMGSGTATSILQVLGIASLSALPRSFYGSLLRGMQRMEFNNAIDVATMVLQQFGTILILELGGGLFHIVYWMSACYGLSLVAYILASCRFFAPRSFVPVYAHGVAKRVWRFASKMIAVSVLSMINWRVDKVIISYFLPVGMLGYYSFASNASSKIDIFTSSIAGAAFPSFSELYKSGDRKQLVSQYMKLQELICFMTVPIFAIVPFAVLPVFTYIFTGEIATLIFLPITLLSLGHYMNGTLNTPYQISIAMGKPEITIKTNIYTFFFILPVNIFLIYSWGLKGAGLSYVLLNLFAYLYFLPRTCKECIGTPVGEWYLMVLKALVLTGFTYGFAWTALEFLDNFSIFSLFVAYIVASTVFLIAVCFMIGSELRENLYRYALDIITKLKSYETGKNEIL